jgi:hypothetical protein
MAELMQRCGVLRLLGLGHNLMVCSASNGQALNNKRLEGVSACDFSSPGSSNSDGCVIL